MVHGPRFLASFSTLSTEMPMVVNNNEQQQPHLVHKQASHSIVICPQCWQSFCFCCFCCCVDRYEIELEMENGSRPVCLPPAYKMFATKPFRYPFCLRLRILSLPFSLLSLLYWLGCVHLGEHAWCMFMWEKKNLKSTKHSELPTPNSQLHSNNEIKPLFYFKKNKQVEGVDAQE